MRPGPRHDLDQRVTATAGGDPARASLLAQIQSQLRSNEVEITNRERGQFGLPALSLDDRLNASALAHNRLMVDQGFFSHQGPGEPELGDRVRDQGYNWSAVGENIAAGQATPEEATSSATPKIIVRVCPF